jgi:hypothetical protein
LVGWREAPGLAPGEFGAVGAVSGSRFKSCG